MFDECFPSSWDLKESRVAKDIKKDLLNYLENYWTTGPNDLIETFIHEFFEQYK